LDEKDPLEQSRALRELSERAFGAKDNVVDSLRLSVAASVLADLTEQGWKVRFSGEEIRISPPSASAINGESVDKVKSRIRQGLRIASDRQIATKSVQDFIKYVEKDRVYNGQIVSVRSLIDDGKDLEVQIKKYTKLNEDEKIRKLKKIIKPVIQVCDASAVCEYTGLKLQDVWRYCRHTWALEYNPVPGRTLRILIRNKARKNWPIIGIAMLASPAANYYVRDKWIGWRIEDISQRIVDGGWDPKNVAKVLMQTVIDAISDTRSDDLVHNSELEEPNETTFFKLSQSNFEAKNDRQKDLIFHRSDQYEKTEKIVDIRNFDKSKLNELDWKTLSRTSLYVKKRSEQLLTLLTCLRFFKDAGFEKNPGAALCESLVTRRGREQVAIALNEIRKRRIATEVADVSVCGGIEPYTPILAGKLVALLMASAEVQDAYRDRYSGQVSEIASQIAGKPIRRSAELRVLTTTSLYGIASSQYNRLVLRASDSSKLTRDVRWEELAKTQGMTVTHLSKLTVRLMQKLGEKEYGTRRINSVFGEGSSPRTRQVREGLYLIGLNGDDILKQGLTRRVYACEVYPDARSDLHGFDGKSAALRPQKASAISHAWIERWVTKRVMRLDVLDQIKMSGPENVSKVLQERADCANFEEPRSDPQLNLLD